MKSGEIRKKFLDYFEQRGHTIVPSASLIPAGDPTLLFTNAGMVQFKDVFLGNEKRSYTRAATVQKCLRVSGKHNDLDTVGPSPQHHTFFEMLGNFSFGDYFKEEVISFAWEFLTRELGLPPDALHPTVFEADDESAQIWSKVKGVPATSIVRLGPEDNFWAMGDTGPCGPNSEIIYDRAGRCLRDGSDCPITCDCDRWWETWNLVFMQYDRSADGTLAPLAQRGVDTGMGFERLTSILQGVSSNYETDLFAPLLDHLRELTGDTEIASDRLPAYRAIADHARAVAFLIGDRVMPSNEGRGYILRRILRRASYHGRILGLDRPFLSELCAGTVVDAMADAYPELLQVYQHIAAVVEDEEERFLATLDAGLTRLDRAIEIEETGRGRVDIELKKEQPGKPTELVTVVEGDEGDVVQTKVLSGEEAFRLYDTFGFPLDLTRKVLEAHGWSVDEAGFERALEEQRERGREALAQDRDAEEALAGALRDVPATSFLGYETMAANANVLALFAAGERAQSASEGDAVQIVLDQSPFYAEGGGQAGDRGRITSPGGEVEVETVHRTGRGVFVHSGRVVRGHVAGGEAVRAEVDEPTRRATMRNHTATHLLHRALRVVLGPQAKQAGSLVAPDRLRFDFLHGHPLSDGELRETERIVQEQVLLDRQVRTEVLPLQEALALGADAMFDEKYGEEARVVSVGDGEVFSRELCGGTHCRHTGEIGAFFITEQRSVGAGVRRVEAVTGLNAFEWMSARRQVVEQLAREYNVPPAELPERLRALQERAREQPKVASAALPDPKEVLERAEHRDGTLLILDRVDGADANALRDFGDELRGRVESAAVVLGSVYDGKLNVVVMLTADLVQRGLHAGKLAKEIGGAMGAGGGGRPDVATAGGDPSRLDEGLAKARELLG